MLKRYKLNGKTYQFEEGKAPAGAVLIEKKKPARKTRKPANKARKAENKAVEDK